MTPAENFAQSRAEAEQLIRQHAPARLQDAVIERLLPTIALTATRADDADIAIGASKFGGAPDVPDGFEWPMSEPARLEPENVVPSPLEFLAQINLGEVAPFDLDDVLPTSGNLLFFVHWRYNQWRVLHFDEPLKRAQKPALDFVCSLASPENYGLFLSGSPQSIRRIPYEPYKSCDGLLSSKIVPQGVWSMPLFPYWSRDARDSDLWAWSEQDQKSWWKLASTLNPIECDHYVLGNPVQGQPDRSWEARYRAAADTCRGKIEDWHLLLQVSSDDSIGLDFDDKFFIFFLIHRDDLAARDFSLCYVIYERQF